MIPPQVHTTQQFLVCLEGKFFLLLFSRSMHSVGTDEGTGMYQDSSPSS